MFYFESKARAGEYGFCSQLVVWQVAGGSVYNMRSSYIHA